ncbi:MAG: hypothetical protein AAFN11_03330 [Chloroflexota bacterium]
MQDVQQQDTLTETATDRDLNLEVVDPEDEEYGPPKGTVAFITLMLAFYIIYYAVHYFEIFIMRGA